MTSATERRDLLKAVFDEARVCVRCPLHQSRTQVVFGSGNADAGLMFIGEAPGAHEDKQGLPFVGQAGKLLDRLLAEIELERADVFVANALKCLRYDANVQLADGSWERIGRLVRTRYDGEVMSVSADGALVPRRVVGWHATPLGGRRVFRLTHLGAKRAGNGKVSVRLTGDHPVLTEHGYVAVQDLQTSDRIATGQGLSELAHDVMCGTLLGDGSLGARSSSLTLVHSERQHEYALFKARLLSELTVHVESRAVRAVIGGSFYDTVHVRTRAHRALRVLRHDFYRPTKVVPPWISDQLNPRMLAFWFMDDGYTRIGGGGRRPSAELASNAFSDDCLQVLLRGLDHLGLPAKALRRRIFLGVDATVRLCELIAPYVPPSMRYKLSPEVAACVPFAPEALAAGPARVMFDEIEVEDITARARADATFFCIDVEDTHNFVTAGGVVHNCRPPGNRDPQPNEIESCRSYLERQVELIEPDLICTLGNFSTKLLRADSTGISRLHGQVEERTLGPRAVRLYPLYHPAAALYTPATLEALRTDFRRIPELLALGPLAQPAAVQPVPEPLPEPAAPELLSEPLEPQLGLF